MLAAADTERQRIAADIHDGAQQHFSALRIRLGELVELTEFDPPAAGALARRLGTLVDQALADLRGFVHGIYPAELRSLGLVPALREAARVSPIRVAVHSRGVGRYSDVLENAVYFTCLEALQNAVKHAPASAVRLTLTEQNGRLDFDVHDDGPGIARDAQPGVGFSSMHARIAYVRGHLTIEAREGAGTHVRGTVPIESQSSDHAS
jgi:signal transduction histidine kinase